jgi:hypothetical protein
MDLQCTMPLLDTLKYNAVPFCTATHRHSRISVLAKLRIRNYFGVFLHFHVPGSVHIGGHSALSLRCIRPLFWNRISWINFSGALELSSLLQANLEDKEKNPKVLEHGINHLMLFYRARLAVRTVNGNWLPGAGCWKLKK